MVEKFIIFIVFVFGINSIFAKREKKWIFFGEIQKNQLTTVCDFGNILSVN